MASRVGICTEPIGVTSADVNVGVGSQSASSMELDTPALAIEYVLASIARLEARLDASERRATIAQPPPRPDPDPPYADWQRGREESGRQNAIVTAATVSSIPQLGFASGNSSRQPQQTSLSGPSPWDHSGETVASRQQLGFVGHSTRIANQPPRTEQLPWDRYGGGSDGFRGRRHTAWDNPTHRFADQPGRLAMEWDNAWGGRNSDQPRYDHYRVEKPCYEKMRAHRFDGSDVVNWISRELRPENPEMSNSALKEEISSELGDADSLVVHSNQDVETDSKVEGNQTFTMRELLNELKNGDGHDLREQDQRMLNPSNLDDQKVIANMAINTKDAKVVARSEVKCIAEVAAGGLGNLKVGEES